MKCFHCDNCGMMVFFENDRCVKCDLPLGFLPDVLELSALKADPKNELQALAPPAAGRSYRHCANGPQLHACNWMVPAGDANPLCTSCRLTDVIPDLKDSQNVTRWTKLERAKRRCLYLFLKLGLPIENAAGDTFPSLRFRFLQDKPNEPVKTGHQDGLITVNIAEADDDEREHRRLTLHEPYRTLIGHLRHESGHYYWDRLIANSDHIPRYRELFGDETADYEAALKTYYQQGPPADWQNRTVTAYASSHPWEEWAETWAHYLHIMDTLETAACFGLSVNPDNAANNDASKALVIQFEERQDFNSLLTSWIPLTCALNSINRGMGLSDLYPFVISPSVTEKLRFIHSIVQSSKAAQVNSRVTNQQKVSVA